MQTLNLEDYLSQGVEKIVKGVLKASIGNPGGSLFMAKFLRAAEKARLRRTEEQAGGKHIPPFLIASITRKCNLHCVGCYAWGNHSCGDSIAEDEMTGQQWQGIFEEARDLGISFVLLAGGEPFVRADVLEAAGSVEEILFPVFTNGTMLEAEAIKKLKKHRNLVPIFSIEGSEKRTDSRRGAGIYQGLIQSMTALKKNGLLFGASVTVTKENLKEVTSAAFLEGLYTRGCKAVIYVEYVPVSDKGSGLAPEDAEREYLAKQIEQLRKHYEDMLFIAFPGDEKSSGGCLAAGRGFFHINAVGGAEPCPFSPYSDTSVRESSLREALASPLFKQLQEDGTLMEAHAGGCVLFEREQRVQAILRG